MSTYITDDTYQASMEQDRLDEMFLANDLGAASRRLPDFANTKALRPFKAGYDPESDDVYNATKTYLALTPEQQLVIDLNMRKSVEADRFNLKSSKAATPEDFANMFGYTGRDGLAKMTEMMSTMTPEDREEFEKNYNYAIAQMTPEERVANATISNPEIFPELALMKQKVALGDSLFRRGTTAFGNAVAGTLDSSRRGMEQLATDVIYAGIKQAYNAGELIDHIFNTRIADPAEREAMLESLREFSEASRNNVFVPRVQSGGNLYEDFVGTLGSLGTYITVGLASPALAKAMIYSSGYEVVRTHMGDMEPDKALLVSAPLGAAYGWINQIALKTWLAGARNPLKFGAASLARQGTAEFIADFSSVWIEQGAYQLGGALTGDQRDPFSASKTMKDAVYSGALGAAGSVLLGGAQVPRWVNAQRQYRAFRNAYTTLTDSLTKVLSLDDQGNFQGTQAAMKIINDHLQENSISPLTFVRAKDVQSLGGKAINIFLEETGMTQEELTEAVKYDRDLALDTTAALMAAARSNVAEGKVPQLTAEGLKTMPGNDKLEQQRAGIIGKVLDAKVEAISMLRAFRTRIGFQTEPGQLDALEKKIAELQDKPQITDADAAELRALVTPLVEIPKVSRTLADHVRPDTFAPSLLAMRDSEGVLNSVIAEFDARERISPLDDIEMIKNLRAELMDITGNASYVSSTMHIIKTMLNFLAESSGVTATEYANTIALNTILSDKSLNTVRETSRQMREMIEEDGGKTDVEDLRRSRTLSQQADQLQSVLDTGLGISNAVLKVLGLEGAMDQSGIVKGIEGHIRNLRTQAEEAKLPRSPAGGPTAEQRRAGRIKGALDKIAPRAYQMHAVKGAAMYSTVIHEFFHAFLDLSKTDAPVWYAALEKEVGGPLFTRKGTATEAQEVLANQFEAYLREGKAPSVGLSRVFKDYKRFLGREDVHSYISRKKISPDLHTLFDLMFADRMQMRLAEEMSGLTQTLITMNTPIKNVESLIKKEEKAKLTAEERRNRKILKIYLEMNPQLKANIEQDVSNEVDARNETQFWNILQDEKVVDFRKLKSDPDTAIKDYQRFDEVVLDIFGPEFSRDDALQLLATLRSPKETKRIESKIRIQQTLQEIIGQIPEDIATEALHNPDMSDYLDSLQMAIDTYLIREDNKKIGRQFRAYESAAIKEVANDFISKMKFRNATSYRKFVGEFKSSIIAYQQARMHDDVQGMSEHLANARMKHHMITEAVKARDLAKKLDVRYNSERKVQRLTDPMKVMGPYGEAIRTIIGKYFNRRIEHTDAPIELESTPLLSIDAGVEGWIQRLENSNVKSYKDLTHRQVMDLVEAIEFLRKAGSEEMSTFLETRYATVSSRVLASIEQMKKMAPRSETYRDDKTLMGVVRRARDAVGRFALLTEFVFSAADGFSDISGKGFGPLREMHINVREHFAIGERISASYAAKVSPHLSVLMGRNERFKKEILPQLGTVPEALREITGIQQWTNEATLMVLFNVGNQGNMNTLLSVLERDRINDIVASFTDEEINAALEIARELEPMFKASDEVRYRLTGKRSKAVETTKSIWYRKDGSEIMLDGFYFPIATELRVDKGSDFIQRVANPKLDPRNDFLTERKGTKRPAKLKISTLTNLIDAESHYIATAEVLHDANKVLRDKRFSAEFIKRFGAAQYTEVLDHYAHIANPQTVYDNGNNMGATAINFFRSVGVATSLGFNLSSALKQRMDVLPAVINMLQHNRNRSGLPETMKEIFKTAWAMGIKGNLGASADVSVTDDGEPVVKGKVVDPTTLDPSQFAMWKSAVVRSSINRVDLNLRTIASRAAGAETTVKLWGKHVGRKDAEALVFGFIKTQDKWARTLVWNAQYNLSMQGMGSFDAADMTSAEIEAKAIQDADTISLTMSSNMIADMTHAQRDTYLRAFTPFVTAMVRKGATGWQYVRAAQAGAIGWTEAAAGLASIAYGPMLMIGGMNLLLDSLFGQDEDKKKKRPDEFGFFRDILLQPIIAALDTVPVLNAVSSYIGGYEPQLLAYSAFNRSLDAFNKASKGVAEGNFGDALYYSAMLGGMLGKVPVHNLDKQTRAALKRLGYLKEYKRDGKTFSELKF